MKGNQILTLSSLNIILKKNMSTTRKQKTVETVFDKPLYYKPKVEVILKLYLSHVN